MFRTSQSGVARRLLVFFMPAALLLGTIGAASVTAGAVPTALINEDTVSGSPSQEEQIATAAGFDVTVVSDATWGAMTASEFGAYDLLIAGDPTCGYLPDGLISSASVYGPVVLGLAGGRTSAGNRIVVGTDPVYHDGGDWTSPDARGTIIREGISFAGAVSGTTGMYFDATCAGPLQPDEIVSILEALSAGEGSWTINGVPPCGGSVSLIASHPSFADLSTASLQGWSCSVHESFPTFTSDWSALAVATDTPSHPTCGVDPDTGLEACGEAYLLIAGSAIVVDSLVISVSPLDATNPVGTNHTVTANVHDASGAPPVAGQLVDFTVTGQNAGATGTCVPADCRSDASGNVAFTYTGSNGVGDDTIKASFTDDAGSLQTATAQKHWVPAGAEAHLTLIKTVDNTGGGTASATDWTLTAAGPITISGHTGDPAITNATVSPGTYDLSEDGPTGYTASAWNCTGGTLTGNSLVLADGETASCTINNTFVATGPASYVSILLDRSASMRKNRGDTIRNYNTWLSNQKASTPDASATMALFSSCAYRQRGPAGQPITDLPILTKATYKPACRTPLYDAIAKTINRADANPLSDGNDVVIVVYTDGRENASKNWTFAEVDALIAEKTAEGWTFVWLGESLDPLILKWAGRG
jgi:hypothetical protein